jgi:FlaA1/EpsC-like NDP-sugar epimerase
LYNYWMNLGIKGFDHNLKFHWLLALRRPIKQALAMSLDAMLCLASLWLALSLRLETLSPLAEVHFTPLILSVALALPIFFSFGLYRAVFRFSGARALRAIALACGLYGVFFLTFVVFFDLSGVPRSVGIMQPMILFLFIGGSRWLVRALLRGRIGCSPDDSHWPRILIYGTGEAGRQLVSNLRVTPGWKMVGFVDDDSSVWGGSVDGYQVFNPAKLSGVVRQYAVTDIWLALESVAARRRREVIENLRVLPIHVRTLPSLSDLVSGRVRLKDVHELDLNDLLGRDLVEPHGLLLNRTIRGKRVLVTGAGGSIGSELCRQILSLEPAQLILIDHSEYALYEIHRELTATLRLDGQSGAGDVDAEVDLDVDAEVGTIPLDSRLVPILASVTDETRMQCVFSGLAPETVFHAAAYKHVPMVEKNIGAAVLNNVFGTWVTAHRALSAGVETFILVSTDKAVRPTNIMGASKRLAELIVQAVHETRQLPGQTFSVVRFGNVLGSSGSVVPVFREQIEAGGPITLTHPAITRYFMTIPEAAQLVLQAGGMAKGAEVFVLDMGAPVKIYDLALRMIEFSGLTLRDELNPGGDVAITVTGLRPGEKLYEELLIGGNPEPTSHPKILRAREESLPYKKLAAALEHLQRALETNEAEKIRDLMATLVSGYKPGSRIVDWAIKNRKTRQEVGKQYENLQEKES